MNTVHDFDYLIGSVHVIDRLAVTSHQEMALLVQEYGLSEVLRRYFDEVEAAIHAGLFDGLAHVDALCGSPPFTQRNLYRPVSISVHEHWKWVNYVTVMTFC